VSHCGMQAIEIDLGKTRIEPEKEK
jgi:hypothetical protein